MSIDFGRQAHLYCLVKPVHLVLGGSWGFVTTFNWACNPAHGVPIWPYRCYWEVPLSKPGVGSSHKQGLYCGYS